MRTLIAYRTRYGTTERYARWLAERLPGQTDLADLGKHGKAPLEHYDVIILGSPIYEGLPLRGISTFCERNRQVLLQKKVGLFICCLLEGRRALEELASAYPDWLSLHAFGRYVLGGEVRLSRLALWDRFLVRRLGRLDVDIAKARPEALEEIRRKMEELARGG